MPKKIDDIIVNERRKSIRDVPLPDNRRREELSSELPKPPKPLKIRKRKKFPSKKIWLLLITAALVLIFAILSIFSGATLAYTPKSTPLTFENDTYTANKTSGGGLLFSVVKLSGEKSATVPATGEEQVERKASGTIIIYNSNASSQPLVATTRFETPESKIYRIDEPITVPAKSSVEAVVYADEPGEEYNIGLSDFVLPGLKGTSRFETVYARSKTAMTGGFVGKAKKVSAENLAKATSELEAALREELSTQAVAQVPSDFIIFPSLSTTIFSQPVQSEGQGSSAVIKLSGNYYGVMFKKSDLSVYLASKKAELSAGDVVDIPSLESLELAFSGSAPSDLLNASQITFAVNGTAKLVWKTDEEVLRDELVGAHKSEIPEILTNYPSISTADALIRPFWRSSFPEEPSEISIKRLSVE